MTKNNKLEGIWIGYGSEINLLLTVPDSPYNVQNIKPKTTYLKIVLNFEKIKCDLYKVIETYYSNDGTQIIYPSQFFMVNTYGKNKFTCPDRVINGYDTFEINDDHLHYEYIINGFDVVNKSISGEYLEYSTYGKFKLTKETL